MKTTGQVGAEATAEEVLGSFDSQGSYVAPSLGSEAPVASPDCIDGAMEYLAEEVIDSSTADTLVENLSEAKKALDAGTTSVPATAPAGEDDVAGFETVDSSAMPDADMAMNAYPTEGEATVSHGVSIGTFFWDLNYISDLSLADWEWWSNHEPMKFLRWDDDGCSHVPDSGPFFNFTYSCKRHDFGYRNLHRAEDWYGKDSYRKRNINVADEQFLRDMEAYCAPKNVYAEAACMHVATMYYTGVAAASGTLGYGSPMTYIP